MPREPHVFGYASSSSRSSVSLHEQRDLDVSGKPTPSDGSRSNMTQSGRSGLSTREDHAFMSMQPMFDHPEQRELVVDERVVDGLLLALARRGRQRRCADPVRHVRRRVLLEEVLALPAVGVALHRERPVAQVRHEHRRRRRGSRRCRSPFVIPSSGQNGLSRFESLSTRRPFARRSGAASRSRRTSSARLVVAEAAGRPARAAGRRASTPRTRPRRRAPARPRRRRPAARAASSASRRTAASSRCERPEELEQALDLGVREAGADVPGPAQPARLVHAEDERAEARRAAALALRVADDRRAPAPARTFTLRQSALRRPGWYRESARFATTPSSPCVARRREQRLAVVELRRDEDAARLGSTSCLEPLAPLRRAAGRPAARRRPRAGRTRRARASRCPAGAARSSTARRRRARTISPSRTASGVREPLARRRARPRRKRSGEVVAVPARERRLARRSRVAIAR